MKYALAALIILTSVDSYYLSQSRGEIKNLSDALCLQIQPTLKGGGNAYIPHGGCEIPNERSILPYFRFEMEKSK